MLQRILLLVLLGVLIGACNAPSQGKLDQSFYQTIGFQIREQRILKGIGQQELADAVGMTQNGLSLIEDGMATPIHTKLIAIQNYLQITFEIDGEKSTIEDYLKKTQEK